jgi:hypothetical protein
MTPYLKGIHQTLDSWRPNRDDDGWKLPLRLQRTVTESEADGKAPQRVKAVVRLESDLKALEALLEGDGPPKRRIRSGKVVEVYYGFGDASATGACTNFQHVLKKRQVFELDETIHYWYGHWCTEVSEESLNYRELLNLVEGLEIQVREGGLRDCEVFMFTDNSIAEAVYFKGKSTSRKLFELVLRLRRLKMSGGLILHVIHVAGTRMIDQGADGGSRGDLNQGSMAGESILNFVPLHLLALERSAKLEDWVLKYNTLPL